VIKLGLLNNLSGTDLDRYMAFFSHAKVAVFDAQYTVKEAVSKEDWGHSSSFTGVDIALRAKIQTLVLFHHGPTHDDHTLHEIFQKTREYLDSRQQGQTCNVLMAYEGLQLTV
jgi:ribonuclease BN (tRNA processing enzyme)